MRVSCFEGSHFRAALVGRQKVLLLILEGASHFEKDLFLYVLCTPPYVDAPCDTLLKASGSHTKIGF